MKLLIKTIPAVAKELAGASLTKQKLLTLKLWYFAITRKLGLFRSDFPITGEAHGRAITFYLRYVMDIAVLREVFVEKEYDWFPVENPQVIIDLGAHFGDTTLYYANKYPEANIIAVEPSPENYERLLMHVKNYSNVVPVQAAIGGSDGEIELYMSKEFFGHSVFNRNQSDKKITVPQLSLKSLLQNNFIQKADLIKFDIEGAEFAVFNNLPISLCAKSYIGEVHEDIGSGTLETFSQAFNEFAVEVQKIPGNNRFIFKAQYK